MNMLKIISGNYECDERTYIDKDGAEMFSSYKLLFVALNASGFNSWVVLNFLVKEITELKIVKTGRGLISLSFRCGVKLVNTVEVPQYVKFTCTKSHKKGSLEKIGREYGLRPELPKGENERSVINKSNFADLKSFWEPYFKSDVLCLASLKVRPSMEVQKVSGFDIKDCLTEAILGWKYFGNYKENRQLHTFNDKYVTDYIRKSVKSGRVAALNRFFESHQCEEKLNTIKKHSKIYDNEISNMVNEYLEYVI